jgi:hypothetical protein
MVKVKRGKKIMKNRLQLPGVVRARAERSARPQRGDCEGLGPQYLRSSGGPRHVLAPGKYFSLHLPVLRIRIRDPVPF